MCSLLVAFSLVFRLVYSSLLARLLCLIYTGERRATIRTSRVTSICFPHVSLLLLLFSLSLYTDHSIPFSHSDTPLRWPDSSALIELNYTLVPFSFRDFVPVTKRKKLLDVYSMSFLYLFDVDAFHSLLGWDKNLNKNNNKEGGDFGLLLSVVYGQEKNKFAKQWGGSLLYIYIPSLNGIYLRIRWPIVQ